MARALFVCLIAALLVTVVPIKAQPPPAVVADTPAPASNSTNSSPVAQAPTPESSSPPANLQSPPPQAADPSLLPSPVAAAPSPAASPDASSPPPPASPTVVNSPPPPQSPVLSPPTGSLGGVEVDPTTIIVKFERGASNVPVEVEKRPGRQLGLNLGVVKKRNNESLSEALTRVNNMPGVDYAEPNLIYNISAIPNDPSYGSQWGMSKISAPAAWDLYQGNAANNDGLVCIIDTGIDYNHPDISPNMHPDPALRLGWNAITNSANCMDGNGHGTHCAGVIAAASNNAAGVAGVNWRGRLIGCKFLSDAGSGTTADAIECVNWCVSQGASISSNSWGGGGYSQALYDAINAANTRGHLFIAAAGNDAQNIDTTLSYPASYNLPNIIGVAATDSNDNLAYFSNYGNGGASSFVQIAAPGVGIYSTIPTALGSYASYSGTSMACPHVSGVAALVRSAANATLSAAQLKSAILNNADTNIASLNGKVINGARLNAYKALLAVRNGIPSPPILSPPPPTPFTSVDLAVGALPFTSATLDISFGTLAVVPAVISGACSTYTPVSSRLASNLYRKNVWKLTGLAANTSISVDNCQMPNGAFDSISALLECNADLTTCNCMYNDDGCGVSSGDMVSGISVTSATTYYSIVMPYSQSTTSGAYKLTVKDITAGVPPPSPPPPPAPFVEIPSTPIAVNSTFPFVSNVVNLSSGTALAVVNAAVSACPAGFSTALLSTAYRKNVWKLTGLPTGGTLSVDNCAMTAQWDSISVVLACVTGTNNCQCYVDDDSCGSSAGGDRVTGIAMAGGLVYFYIVMPYQTNVVSGNYQMTLNAVGVPVSSPPPPVVQSPLPAPLPAPIPAPVPAPIEAPVPAPAPAPANSPPPNPPPPSPPPRPPPPSPPPNPPPPSPPPRPPPPTSSPPPRPPTPRSSPPPPVTTSPLGPYTPLSIGARSYNSPIFNLATGNYVALSSTLVSSCARTHISKLTSTTFRKQIYELTNFPAVTRFNVDICLQPNGRWDSIQTLLRCNTALTSCSCITDDDGCGTGGGGILSRVTYTTGYRYFVVVYPYTASIVNTYNVRFAAT